jgi:RHS repeat-associated protein
LARTDSGGSAFYHADGAGNVTALLDGQQNMAARYMYTAFGGLVGKWGPSADANTIRFSSKAWDRLSGTYDFGFRRYAPNLGRWLSQDPLGESGGVNLYGFVHNDPLIYADPLGLQGYIGYGPPPPPADPIAGAIQRTSMQRMFPGPTILDPAEAARIQGSVAQLEYGLGGLVYNLTPLGNLWESGTGTDFNGNRLTTGERKAAVQLAGIDLLTIMLPEGKAGKVPCLKGAKAATKLPEGSFSIIDWIGYPANLPKPTGPFRLLAGAEYDAARASANQANRVMHQADSSLGGLQIHEIQPVRFGGSPTDPANKIPLTPQQHSPATTWWNELQRDLEGR